MKEQSYFACKALHAVNRCSVKYSATTNKEAIVHWVYL